MIRLRNLLLILLSIAVAGCGDDISYPVTYSYAEVSIVETDALLSLIAGLSATLPPADREFVDPNLILSDQFEAPAGIASITLVSETEIRFTSVAGETADLAYVSDGSVLTTPDLTMERAGETLLLNGCLTMIHSPTGPGFATDEFCSHAEARGTISDVFDQSNLGEGDMLSFTLFNAVYR